MSVLITNVIKNSIAEKLGIKQNFNLISINNKHIHDILDFRFYECNKKLELEIITDLGESKNYAVTKGEYESLGLEFSSYLMDKKHSCKNKCTFCFIDQMPKGMRKSLYFKDDDERLSFLFGNYITLTNLTDRELDRIIEMHLSPINISVHTTNPELRVKILKNPKASNCYEILQKLSQNNIALNLQCVLMPCINDGAELIRTLDDIAKLMPNVNSLSLVPVGLTKYRERLEKLEIFDEKSAKDVIKLAESYAENFHKTYNKRVVYCADEFYLKARLPLPNVDYYEGFAQLENGVGMCTLLEDEFNFELSVNEDIIVKPKKISIATGFASYNLIDKLTKDFMKKYPSIKIQTIPIKNEFFGEKITVTGLLTAQDIINQLKNIDLGDNLLLSSSMLKQDEDVFLDDVSLLDLQNSLNCKILTNDNSGEDFFNKLIC